MAAMHCLSRWYLTNRLPQIDEIKFGKIVARGFPLWILRAAPLEEGVGQVGPSLTGRTESDKSDLLSKGGKECAGPAEGWDRRGS